MADPVDPPDNLSDDAANSESSSADDAANAALKAAMAAVTDLRTEAEGGDDSSSEAGATEKGKTAEASAVSTPEPQTATATATPPASEQSSVNLPEFSNAQSNDTPSGIDLLSQVNLNVRIELGRTKMLVEDVLRLNEGSVVELDKLAGDPVDVFVNDRLVARGEVLVLNDAFSVRINEIVGR